MDLRDRRIPFVQITGVDRLLQRVHGPGRLVHAEDRTAPATGAHRLDATLAHLVDCCVVIHPTVPCRWMTPIGRTQHRSPLDAKTTSSRGGGLRPASDIVRPVPPANPTSRGSSQLPSPRGTAADPNSTQTPSADRVIAVVTAAVFALDLWQRGGGEDDLLALLDRATDALAERMRELRLSRSAARAETT